MLKNKTFIIFSSLLVMLSVTFVQNVSAQTNLSTTQNASIALSAGSQEGNQVSINVITVGAEEVAISTYIGEGTANRALLGQAKKLSATSWQYTWDVSAVSAGTYRVFAVALSNKGATRTESAPISIVVKNSSDTIVTTPVATSTPLPIPTLPSVPPISSGTPAASSSTPATGTAADLNALSDIVQNSLQNFEKEGTTAVQNTTSAVEGVTQAIPQASQDATFVEEKSAITAGLSDLLTNTRAEVRDSFLSGEDANIPQLQTDFNTRAKVYVDRLKDLAKKSGVTADTNALEKTLSDSIQQVITSGQETETAFKDRGGVLLYIDSDHDNVSDYDEQKIYGTDPQNPDSDGDGVNDGDEILAGTNPLSSDTTPILLSDPTTSGGVTTALTVRKATVVETEVLNGVTNAKKIKFEGTALPNSFITIFIFSSPIAVTVKTDSEGNWSYVLDKELDDGSHTMYVATVDTTGKILAKSAPVPFVKQAAAVDLVPLQTEQAETSLFSTNTIIVIVGAVVILGILALLFISYEHKKKEEEIKKLGGTTF